MINVINKETGVSKTKLQKDYSNEELIKLYNDHMAVINERKNAELKEKRDQERKAAALNAALDEEKAKDKEPEQETDEAAKEAAHVAEEVKEAVNVLVRGAKSGASIQHIFNEFLLKDGELNIHKDAKGKIDFSMFDSTAILTREDGVNILNNPWRLAAIMQQLNNRSELDEGHPDRLDSTEYVDAKRNFNNRLRRACKHWKLVSDVAYKGTKKKGYAFELKAESTPDTFSEALDKLIEKYVNPSDSSAIPAISIDDVLDQLYHTIDKLENPQQDEQTSDESKAA